MERKRKEEKEEKLPALNDLRRRSGTEKKERGRQKGRERECVLKTKRKKKEGSSFSPRLHERREDQREEREGRGVKKKDQFIFTV